MYLRPVLDVEFPSDFIRRIKCDENATEVTGQFRHRLKLLNLAYLKHGGNKQGNNFKANFKNTETKTAETTPNNSFNCK